MKMIRSITLILFTLTNVHVFAQQGTGQSDLEEVRKLTYNAYLKSSLPLWQKAIERQKTIAVENSDREQQLILSNTYYGYLSATMATKDEDAFAKQLAPAKELLKQLIEDHPKWGEPKAVLSSIMGLEMAYSPMKGAFLGMKSGSLMGSALKQSPSSALVMKLYAGSKQYTPAMWGGDKEVAVEYFNKSISVIESDEDTEQNWLYADALANLGIVYTSLDKESDAKATFEKALRYEPDFGWVKYSLLPKIAANPK